MSDHATQVLEPPMAKSIDEIDEKMAAQRAKNAAAIRLLRAWREGDESDEQEQRETWAYLKQALDEDRLSNRKLFP